MNRVWTEADKAIIRADSLARVPRPVTAAKLGRPVPATRTQALKLQAQIQVHRPGRTRRTWSARTTTGATPP